VDQANDRATETEQTKMNESSSPNDRRPRPVMIRSTATLGLSLVTAFLVLGWTGYVRAGWSGVFAAGVASGICLASGVAALWVSTRACARNGVQAVLIGTLIRTGAPLVLGVILASRGGPLAEAGVFGMILICYLLMLVVETLLAVRVMKSSRNVSEVL
jgi:hypothetical protein